MATRTYPIGSDALIAGLLMPSTNWGQRMAAKDQQLQQQAFLTQQAEQQVLEEQQAAAQIANFQQQIRSLPLERPDKVRVNKWLKGQESVIADRLEKSYGGSLKRFMATEGSSWMQHTLGSLQQSEEYNTGIRNLEQITLAKEAMKKGENLIGDVAGGQYVSAEAKLRDYYAGNSPTFEFKGSYADDDDLTKHFGSQYGPSRYVPSTVPDDQIQNYLLNTKRPEVARDIYARKYAGGRTKVMFKYDPLEDGQLHQMKIQDHQMKVQDHNTDTILKQEQLRGTKIKNAILGEKLKEAQSGGIGGNPANLTENLFRQAQTDGNEYTFEKGGEKQLRYSGYDLNRFEVKNSQGGSIAHFASLPLYGDNNVSLIGQKLGLSKTKDGWEMASPRPIKEAIIEQNGFHAIDLTKSNYKVVNVDNKLLANPRDFNQKGKSTDSNGIMAFARLELQFNDDDDAAAAGLIKDWNPLDWTTKTGTGVYNPDTKRAWMTVPLGYVNKDWNFNQQLLRNMSGQKLANEFYNGMTIY